MLIIVAALVMFSSTLVAAILESLSAKSSQGMARPRSSPPNMYDTSSVKNEVPVSDVVLIKIVLLETMREKRLSRLN